MLLRALRIRRSKQPTPHVQVAYCLVKVADAFWASRHIDQTLPRLTEAVKIFEASLGKRSKQVCQLYSYISLAYICLGNFAAGSEWNEKASELVKPVFGDMSWENHRIKLDRVTILQNSFDKEDKAAQSSEARKAFAMAERVETHAVILKQSLNTEQVHVRSLHVRCLHLCKVYVCAKCVVA